MLDVAVSDLISPNMKKFAVLASEPPPKHQRDDDVWSDGHNKIQTDSLQAATKHLLLSTQARNFQPTLKRQREDGVVT